MKKRHFLLTIFLSILILSNPVFAKIPEFPENEQLYILENSSQDIVLNQQGEEKIAPMEMSQLMAVLVSLDVIGNKLSDTVVVGEEINGLNSAPEITGFEVGQEVSYQDLLYPILLNSSYDATQILAQNIGSQIMSESKADGSDAINAFVKKMNEKAKDLGLKNTSFTNPNGFDEENNYSTIEDLSIITQNAFKNETVKRILGTQEYTIKLSPTSSAKKETVSEDSEEVETNSDSETTIGTTTNPNKTTEKVETPTISISNHFLSVFNNSENQESTIEDDSEETSDKITTASDKSDDKETEEVLTEDKKQEEETQKDSNDQNSVKSSNSNKASSNLTTAFIANLDGENSIVAFESDLTDAQIIGCISGEGAYTIAEQIKTLDNELKTNYTFKNLADESGNLGSFKLENTSLFSKKKLDLTANSEIKAYVPKDQQDQIKTNIIWDKAIANKNDDKVTLVQGIEPGTQVAQLEISKGDIKRLVPLYSATKAGVKSWKDTFFMILFWIILVSVLLLAVWRIIYVKNRRKALRRRRALRRKRMAMQKKQNNNYTSPVNRMAH